MGEPREAAVRADCEPNVVSRLVGRLVVTRVGEFRSMPDWAEFSQRFFSAIDTSPGDVVVCADYRHLRVMNDSLMAAVAQDLERANPKVLRSALLFPTGATNVRLQMERLLREAGNAGRRICSDAAEAKAWLGLRLDAAERAALDQFLAALRPL